MIRMRKRVGAGSLSLLLIALGVIWSFTIGGFCLGDSVLNLLGKRAWSNSMVNNVHYTVFYSLVFIVPAFLLSLKFRDDLGANAGKFLSALIGIFLAFAAMNYQLI